MGIERYKNPRPELLIDVETMFGYKDQDTDIQVNEDTQEFVVVKKIDNTLTIRMHGTQEQDPAGKKRWAISKESHFTIGDKSLAELYEHFLYTIAGLCG